MIDPTLVTRKSKLIAEDLQELELIARTTLKEYLDDHTKQVLAERYLERLIGRMIDINYHLLTETGNPPPPDYFRSFIELGKIRILPPDFARDIAWSAGLRNRLVHEYDEIEAEKVYEGLKAALSDVPRYLAFVNNYVENATLGKEV